MEYTQTNDSARKAAGAVKGKHFTEYVEEVKALKRAGNSDAAIRMLLRLVDAVEAESEVAGRDWPIAPWYYEQIALIYRKDKQFQNEVAILQRYVMQHEKKTDRPIAALVMRLEKTLSLI